jgi:hypothetical protein
MRWGIWVPLDIDFIEGYSSVHSLTGLPPPHTHRHTHTHLRLMTLVRRDLKEITTELLLNISEWIRYETRSFVWNIMSFWWTVCAFLIYMDFPWTAQITKFSMSTATLNFVYFLTSFILWSYFFFSILLAHKYWNNSIWFAPVGILFNTWRKQVSGKDAKKYKIMFKKKIRTD